jgi:hypothetical protein
MTTKNQTNMLNKYEDFVNSGKDLIDRLVAAYKTSIEEKK